MEDQCFVVSRCLKLGKRTSYETLIVEKSNYVASEDETIHFELVKTKHPNFNGNEFYVVRAHKVIDIHCADYEIIQLKPSDGGVIIFQDNIIKLRTPKRDFTFRQNCITYDENTFIIINNRFISFKIDDCNQIGNGMTAVVTKAFDIQGPHVNYALKSFDWTNHVHISDFHISSLTEIEVMRRIGEHSNIVKMLDVLQSPEKTILALELMDQSLAHELHARKGIFSEEEGLFAMQQILNGLSHLHRLEISHNDIKAENILVKKLHDNSYQFKVKYLIDL